MKSNFSKVQAPSTSKLILISFGLAVSISTVAILGCGFILTYFNVENSFAFPLSSVALGSGGFFGSRYMGRRQGNRGYLCGIIIGVILLFINLIASFALGGFSFSAFFFIRAAIVVIMSMLGGIMGVNFSSSSSLVK